MGRTLVYKFIGSRLKAEGSRQKSDPQIKYYPQTCPPIFVEDYADYAD